MMTGSYDRSLLRRVTASGVIWLAGRAYYVSRRLAGQEIPVRIVGGRLIVDVQIPLHKEYALPRAALADRARPWRAARRVS
jgi:hypothetical protein